MEFPKVEIVDQGKTAVILRVLTGPYTPYARHFLVGQDSSVGGQPFITQVSRKVVKVEDAFDSLIPEPVRKAIARGLEVKRQGDWFFIPCPPPQGPSHHLVEIASRERAIKEGWARDKTPFQYGALYQDLWEESTRHIVRPWPAKGIEEGTQVVYRANGHHYVRGRVEAPDHEPLWLKDWHTAHRANSGPWGRVSRRGDD